MARLATEHSAVNPLLLHAVFELALVDVLVTDGAAAFFESIRNYVRGLWAGAFLVAIGARNRDVAARQLETRLFVLRQRKRGWPVALQVVAVLAPVQVRSVRKLPLVLVLVTVHTLLEFHPVDGLFPFRDMTSGALHGRMLALQGISASGVFLNPECRRLEPFYRVTGRALSFVRALDELTVVFVFVAVHALLKC